MKRAAFFLMIQNLLLLLPFCNVYVLILLPIELIGFLLLTIGCILGAIREFERPHTYLGVGVCILGWLLCRITYQYLLPAIFEGELIFGPFLVNFATHWFWSQLCFGYFDYKPPYTQYMALFFILGGLLLGVASILIYYVHKGKARVFMMYGITNFLILLVTFLPYLFEEKNIPTPSPLLSFILYFLKLILFPLLGALAFHKLNAQVLPPDPWPPLSTGRRLPENYLEKVVKKL